MEKEQKKLLLVAVSVGVFLLVTITVALIIVAPKFQTHDISLNSSLPVKPEKIQDTENTDNSSQPIINNSNETNIIINGSAETPIISDNSGENSLIIQIPKPITAAVPNTQEISVITPANPDAAKKQTTVTPSAKPVVSTRTPAKPAAASKPAAVSSKTTSPAKTFDDYWIQTGAFSAKIRAEDAKELLDSKGLVSIIENREINGKIWYRVRVGPYTSEKEANYWLALVKAIDGFEESQVRQSIRQL